MMQGRSACRTTMSSPCFIFGSEERFRWIMTFNRLRSITYLHLARVQHQLALRNFDLAESKMTENERIQCLRVAEEANEQARKYADDQSCKEFPDPELDYGIEVLRSMIHTARDASDMGRQC